MNKLALLIVFLTFILCQGQSQVPTIALIADQEEGNYYLGEDTLYNYFYVVPNEGASTFNFSKYNADDIIRLQNITAKIGEKSFTWDCNIDLSYNYTYFICIGKTVNVNKGNIAIIEQNVNGYTGKLLINYLEEITIKIVIPQTIEFPIDFDFSEAKEMECDVGYSIGKCYDCLNRTHCDNCTSGPDPVRDMDATVLNTLKQLHDYDPTFIEYVPSFEEPGKCLPPCQEVDDEIATKYQELNNKPITELSGLCQECETEDYKLSLCKKCLNPNDILVDGSCLPCELDNCLKCDSTNLGKCLQCVNKNYEVNTAGQCILKENEESSSTSSQDEGSQGENSQDGESQNEDSSSASNPKENDETTDGSFINCKYQLLLWLVIVLV